MKKNITIKFKVSCKQQSQETRKFLINVIWSNNALLTHIHMYRSQANRPDVDSHCYHTIHIYHSNSKYTAAVWSEQQVSSIAQQYSSCMCSSVVCMDGVLSKVYRPSLIEIIFGLVRHKESRDTLIDIQQWSLEN